MKTNFIWRSTIYLLCVFIAATSCKHEPGIEPVPDGITMQVYFATAFNEQDGPDTQDKQMASVRNNSADSEHGVQTRIIPLSNGLTVVAKLIPDRQTDLAGENTTAKDTKSAKALRASASLVKSALPVGTKYRLLVYDEDGKEIKRFDKTVDENSSSFAEFTLDATAEITTFTFVAYSAGTDDLPDLAPNSTLSNAMVTVQGEKFMHFVKSVGLGYGVNPLDVVLENKLCEINTVIDGKGVDMNSIKGVGGVLFKTANHSKAVLQLSSGAMTYNGVAQDKKVAFPILSAPLTELSSTAALLSGTTTTSLEVEYIDVVGRGRSEPFTVQDVKIEPGVRYRLVLELGLGNCMFNVRKESFDLTNTRAGCRFAVLLVFQWVDYTVPRSECSNIFIPFLYRRSWTTPNNGETIGKQFQFSAEANAGVVIDITRLDNSFNMSVNDPDSLQNTAARKIATAEIQFQEGSGLRRNIRFTDGTSYGSNGIPEIWDIRDGTADNPILRVNISSNGTVSIQGRKKSGETKLYPMELFNGARFNTVTWNTDGSTPNKVTVTQLVEGATYIDGVVTGKRKGPCIP